MPMGVYMEDETARKRIQIVPHDRMPKGHVLVRVQTPGSTVFAVREGHYRPADGRMSAELRAAMARHAQHAAWLEGAEPEQNRRQRQPRPGRRAS